MRLEFFKQLHELMTEDNRVYFVTGDLGYFFADKIREDFPDRFINSGAAECAMMGIGIGLALEGKIPFVYSITPFLLYRPFEAIRNYLNFEQIPVVLVGSGRDKQYEHDGMTHWGEDVPNIMKSFDGIESFYPDCIEELSEIMKRIKTNNKPLFIALSR